MAQFPTASGSANLFDLLGYQPKQVTMKTIDNKKELVLQINPESISESVRTKIETVDLINSNLPRRVVTGTDGRRVTFTALFHGMVASKPIKNSTGVESRVQTKDLGQRLADVGRRVASNIPSTTASIVPFGANVVRGIKAVSDIAGLDVSGLFGADKFRIASDFRSQDVESAVDALFSMQVAPSGRTAVKRVRLTGYKAYEGMDFYIADLTVNRRLFDKNLNTQFVEVSVTLEQVGAVRSVGKFFRN